MIRKCVQCGEDFNPPEDIESAYPDLCGDCEEAEYDDIEREATKGEIP